MKIRYFLLVLLLLNFVSIFPQTDPAVFGNLRFRFIGPEGNRTIAMAGVAGDPMTTYIGAASGGLWKTSDGGISWNPIFDAQDVSSIGSVAITPTNPDIIWVGTGETFVIRPAHAMGDGIYKSEDGGKTWINMGLEKTGRIGRILVHPTNPNVVYAAALGHTYGRQQERGVFKTTDGGKNWERIFFVDENTGAAELAMDPKNPDRLLVGMWSIHINTWGLNSGGPGGGVYRTLDGGDTWEPLSKKGLPGGKENPVGKTAVAISHSSPNIVYALFEIESPALYRSEDFGDSWTLQTRNHDIAERAPYYTRMAVSTSNPNELYFASVKFSISKDGGKTIESGYSAGGDNHDIWVDPTNADRLMVAHDGGASISINHGKTFQRIVLPIAQMYHVAVDDKIPYNVYGNRQDGYSYMGPSNSKQGYIPLGLWKGVGGCESGFAQPDPFDNDIVWSGCYDGGLQRYNVKTGHARDVRVWPEAGYGWEPGKLKYRWHWNFPLAFSPHTKHRVYVGSQYVHKSDDGGQSWQVISPDLTLNDKTHQQNSGGIAVDNLMTFDGSVLFSIVESTLEPGLIWTGSNDGQVQLTKNGGTTWTNVTSNIPDLPKWGTIANIEASRYKKGSAYITVDLHQMGDFYPYVYKTEDYGQTWKLISDTVPKSVHSFAHVIKEDPKREGMLYLGVDNGLYISHDDGEHWMRLRNNLPPAPVYWLEIQERFDDLVVGTYGRGYYIMDNISPLREYDMDAKDKEAHLFSLRPVYRFQDVQSIKTDGPSLNSGTNPAYGAEINYFLKDSTDQKIEIQILTMEDEVVRTLEGKNKPGVNRVMWNLRYEPTYKPKLQTTPPGRPWVQLNGEGWRPLVTWDLDLMRGQYGPKVVPDSYKVKLVIGNKEYIRELEVLKDPSTEGSLEDIQKQVAFSLELRDAMNLAVTMINDIEAIRAELNAIIPKLSRSADRKKAEELRALAIAIAGSLYDIHLTGAREDAFRSPIKLYGRLSALASDIGGFGADFKPTDQQQEVYTIFNERLKEVDAKFKKFITVEVEKLNSRLKQSELQIQHTQKIKS
ncbi:MULTISPECIES: WD40/YVTN/BNR-like repeat-containing protein [Maribacter]|uniref:Glycosyl hydrolase n=1 Tax=Maribacter flavus TaxID=1658664 RepID=A0ABU7IEA8_9FLAO|nr:MULTISPECIES: glycosyl hydrolase [Maribacter]MDC6404134.1 glycosyl hydrolase [Maribacter sp. PR66]MEE1971275.1 glycosyl hydrolase [Maribacter flavus]